MKPDSNSEKENNFQQSLSKSEKNQKVKNKIDKIQENIDIDNEKLHNACKRKRSLSFSSSVELPKKEHLSSEKSSTVKNGKKHKSKKSVDDFENKVFKNKKGMS